MHSARLARWFAVVLPALCLLAGWSGVRAETMSLASEDVAILRGLVYADLDGDAVRDDFEKPLASVKIWIEGVDEEGQDVRLWTKTAADGTYFFDDLAPGTYSLLEEQPYQYVEGKPNAPGTAGGKAQGGSRFVDIELAAGVEATGYNFGEWGLKPRYVTKRSYLVIVPEPSAILLLLCGIVALAWGHRRRRATP